MALRPAFEPLRWQCGLPQFWTPARPHVHGDLNGANILVDLKGMAWLIDFSYSGPAMASAFDDHAKLLASLLLE